jgi:ABC-2 type transport system ATP-binding protein
MDCRISVEALTKVYRIPVRDAGLLPAVKSLFRPLYNDVAAVSNIGFTIGRGEMVGFIGPNGAGKTTTLKMLSGLLYPTSGNIRAAGFVPWERRPEYLKKIGMLMGNKSQLTWDNTIQDSFQILKEIYGVPSKEFKSRTDELYELLELGGLAKKLARTLSLGERARCELAAVLIHKPDILYLDEPTLGLDVSMQLRLRDFIRDYNRKYGTTVILTSHYMSDIVSLCPRVLLIHQGRLVFDGGLAVLSERTAPFKLVRFEAAGGGPFNAGAAAGECGFDIEPVEVSEAGVVLRVRKEHVVRLAAYLTEKTELTDLSIVNPPIEAVIDRVYREGIES